MIKPRSRVLSIRDGYPLRTSVGRRNGIGAQCAGARGRREPWKTTSTKTSAESSEMAFTCKVQYLDDTDPFASTNFPEPTRPPSCTLHMNIPLCEQVAGLHKLLKAPHNVSEKCRVYWNFAGYFDKSGVTGLLFTFLATALRRFHSSPQRYFHSISVRRRRLTNPTKRYLSGLGKHFGGTSRRVGRFPWQVTSVWQRRAIPTCACVGHEWMIGGRPDRVLGLSCTREVAKIFTHDSLFFFFSRKSTILLRTQLSVRVHNCIGEYRLFICCFRSGFKGLWYGEKRTRITNFLYVIPVRSRLISPCSLDSRLQ